MHWFGACLLLSGAVIGATTKQARAQWDVSGNASITTPLPLGQDRPDSGGFYFAGEFLFMHANRNIGNQVIAARGFRDSDGSITGTPGQYVGSRRYALSTEYFGRTTWTPGFRATAGYRFADGLSLSVSYAHLFDAKYTASAGPIPIDFLTGLQGEETLLFAPVFNFSPEFAGPANRFGTITNGVFAPIGSGGSPYGIWNGASNMSIAYTQRFDNYDITARIPVYETDYARTYALAGGRFAWIWERFGWNTITFDAFGNASQLDSAEYTNIVSQRMYGPFLGCGNEIYLGSSFALSADFTGSFLYSVVKERAKYIRADEQTQAKKGRMEYTIVPNAQGSLNLWWYPLPGVQIRAGYELMSFFNTIYMAEPVSFNFGAIDPAYNHRPVRIFHGFHVGISVNF